MIGELDIGIVGGSIAGCSAAILLSRAGHSVRVFERSQAGLVGRGGGIGTPTPVFDELIDSDIVDSDMPRFTASSMPFVVRTEEHADLGYVPWQMPIGFEAFHWTTLWNQLRGRVPDDVYHRGHEVVSADTSADGKAILGLKDGSDAEFDLVLFADGYQSFGRRHLFPEVGLDYRGYMLWRGLLPEGGLEDSEPLEGTMPRLSYTALEGNFVVYFVPSREGATDKGQRLCNWAAYIPLSEAELGAFMIDRECNVQYGAIAPGRMRLADEDRLKGLMAENLPSWYAKMVARTQDTFVQLIYTVEMPAYHKGPMCLIGDAGAVAQPFTGSGVFKGYNNVVSLLDALAKNTSLAAALDSWDREQVALGNRLLALGRQMEKAFIWESPDLASFDEKATSEWWKRAVAFPDDFSY